MTQYNYDEIRMEVADEVLERFLRYVRIHTTSDESVSGRIPSTECQWDLIRLLEKELRDMGIPDIYVDSHGYIIARVPGNTDKETETIGFMAHVDTNADAPSEGVNPLIHSPYNGEAISLENNLVLDPKDSPALLNYKGDTLISSDGTTLLGADDKAGVAEIMTAVHYLLRHPELEHGEIEIILTPDEETGKGMNLFPVDRLNSRYCFTMDGGEEGELESECYNARRADVSFFGKAIHPGTARGKLLNAVTMASSFVSMIPRNESPEATDGYYGNYWPHRISGTLEQSNLAVFLRSFDKDDLHRRSQALERFALAVESAFPGSRVEIKFTDQYRNMREVIDEHPRMLEIIRSAYRDSEVEPIEKPIRGGTDGSRLTFMGIPTPNIFAGGHNMHSRLEWVSLSSMIRAVTVILNITNRWLKK